MAGFDIFAPDLALLENHFIEASAGTGKTYAIETLILRLIVQEGIGVDQILVVTFTKLATRELVARIRARIQATLELLKGTEPLPLFLENACSTGNRRAQVTRQLKSALALMENAKIVTIHSFCLHILQHFLPHAPEEQVSSASVLATHIKDYLRTELDGICPEQLQLLLKDYRNDFEALVAQLGHLACKRTPILCGSGFATTEQTIKEILRQLKESFGLSPEKLLEDLSNHCTNYKGWLNRQKALLPAKQKELERFVQIVMTQEGSFFDLAILSLVAENQIKKPKELDLHYPGLLERMQQELFALLGQLSDPLHIFAQVAEGARNHLARVVEKDELFFYDDLLIKAAKLIEDPKVVQEIQGQFQAVFIDEFQDTDPVQWKIFSSLFSDQSYKGPLYVVGDPKQSIYRFRHADLYTYMEAKKTFQHCVCLDRNYRSAPLLVEALNAFLTPCEDFLHLPAKDLFLPCPSVHYDPSKENKSAEFGLWSVADEEQLFAQVINQAIFLHKEQGIEFSQMAVLVKDRYQMARFKELCEIAIVSPNEAPVTESASYELLYELIDALLHPWERAKVKKALFSPIFRSADADLESLLDKWQQSFYRWAELLEKEGILSLFYALMQTRGAALLAYSDGESLFLDMQALVVALNEKKCAAHFLCDALEKVKKEQSVQRSPCENESALKVMTIHMSKGLEFDTVFAVGTLLPTNKTRALIYAPEKNAYILPDKKSDLHQQEVDAEKMRLLYVALTRAQNRLYLPFLAEKKKNTSSAVDYFFTKRFKDETIEQFAEKVAGVNLSCFENERITAQTYSDVSTKKLAFSSAKLPTFQPQSILSFSSMASYKPQEFTDAEPTFPAGKEVGTLLHKIFEKIDFSKSYNLAQTIYPMIKESVLAPYQEAIVDLVAQTLHIPLKSRYATFCLADLDPSSMQKEVEFLYSEKNEAITGAIDLVVHHAGKYYILDWKSNFLPSYEPDDLEEVMQQHQYHLQAKLYKEALVRWLRLYDPDPQFGGYFYLFLRGICKNQTRGIYYHE